MRISTSCLQAASVAALLSLTALSQSAFAADPATPADPAAATTAAAASPADPNAGVETVVVTAEQNFRPGALKTGIVKTEVLAAPQIQQVGAVNINEALDKHPGIQVQVECSICNVRNITLDHLPGRFTTLMIDGVPLFSSLSSAYGLDSVNVRGIKEIDVSRGAGASLIAPDALAGTVNIVTKRPDGFELEGDVTAGEHNRQDVTLYVGDDLSDEVAATLTASFNKHASVDNNGDNLSEYTGYTRYMAGVALFGDFGNIHAKLRLDYVDEKRGGGSMNGNYHTTKSSTTGNPFDWSKSKHGSTSSAGWYAPDGSGFLAYDDGAGGMSEIIFTKRASAIGTVVGDVTNAIDWEVRYGYARNSQHSFYENTLYNANGNQAYSEVAVHYHHKNMVITVGGNYRYQDLDSISAAPGDKDATTGKYEMDWVDGLDNYVYRTPGGFAQFYDTFFDEKLEVNASIRYDNNSTFGGIWSPRANFLWHHSDNLSSRLSMGRGFRAPTSFFEQDHGILDTTKIIREINNPETSDNLSYALNYSNDRLSATVSYNYNEVKHYALLDSGGTAVIDGEETDVTYFEQADHAVIIQGFDGTVGYQVLPSLQVSVGGEHYFYSFDPGTLAFSRPDWRLFFSADWDYKDLDLFGRVTVTGPHNLKKFYGYQDTQRYNFDGTPKLNKSPVFATMDMKATYHLTDTWSLYLGANNLFDYVQTDKEDPRWIDAEGNFDVTQIWGPMLGREVYGGIKLSL